MTGRGPVLARRKPVNAEGQRQEPVGELGGDEMTPII
jgi:hypothetical protein